MINDSDRLPHIGDRHADVEPAPAQHMTLLVHHVWGPARPCRAGMIL